jgi:hypothetical protein
MPKQTLTQYAGAGPIQKHHCTFCRQPSSERCLKKGHVGYCSECERIFNVQSHTGCNEHKYRDGFNLRYKRNSSYDTMTDAKQMWMITEGEELEELEREQEAEQADRVDYGWDKDWKKEERRLMDKVPKAGKKDKKKCGGRGGNLK